jgi:hypothetical protein
MLIFILSSTEEFYLQDADISTQGRISNTRMKKANGEKGE